MRILPVIIAAGLLLAGCESAKDVPEAFAGERDEAVSAFELFMEQYTERAETPPFDYITPPPTRYEAIPRVAARGVYVSSNSAGIPSRLEGLAEVCAESGMNAMVIDVRTENEIPIKRWVDFADEWGVSVNNIPDIGAVMETLAAYDIYPIARVVTFLDGYTVEHRPDLYIHNPDGSVWLGPQHNGVRYPWLNPYNRETWDYVLTYAVAAAQSGFKEIQFDYVRFAATSKLEEADFGDTGGLSRTEIITAFLEYAVETLRPYKVRVAADVYGTVINSDIDAAIVGQDYAALARVIDVICPMVYPSHFAEGTFGIPHPDMEPYELINKIMLKSNQRIESIPEDERRAVVRPWLQDFTASYLRPYYLDYGQAEREAQIRGAYDAGLDEWLLWDSGNHYEPETD